MKKLITAALMACLTLFVIVGCGESEKTENNNSQAVKSQTFEQVGYWKGEKLPSGAINRSYTIYTTATDEVELINYARNKMHTDLGFTMVHFYNTKDKTPDITTLISVEDAIAPPSEARFFVYKKTPNGNEFVYDGSIANEKQL